MPLNVEKVAKITVIDGVRNEENSTTMTAICERCEKSIMWNEEQIAKDDSTLPDDFFRLLVVELNQPVEGQAVPQAKKLIFCGKRCAKQFFDYDYIPVLSPKEFVAQAAANAQAQAVSQIQPDLANLAQENSAVPMPSVEVLAVGAINQADGTGATSGTNSN